MADLDGVELAISAEKIGLRVFIAANAAADGGEGFAARLRVEGTMALRTLDHKPFSLISSEWTFNEPYSFSDKMAENVNVGQLKFVLDRKGAKVHKGRGRQIAAYEVPL